MQQPKTRNKR